MAIKCSRCAVLRERLWLVGQLVKLIFSEKYDAARYAVRKVAVDPSYRDLRGPLAYDYIRNHSGLYHLQGENLIRGLEARVWTGMAGREAGIPISMQSAGLLAELAYHALKTRGK